ncbi:MULTISPECIES: hypothetical protein [Fischerella]|uniref:Uncharacterized protein n=1 Tax=Fischerella muscicola CCMEE 5323 TaxID=2019572 RepID=A0A2N6JWT8_FISMU|nr:MULTISPECIES: hypothetical protein [Fischerella]MBD2433329.1 hypothetical protein [Fischerella sp. FACHB-380]PLZ84622.1 hypothetical protein CEN44_24340 [Fischerella muscicola CCMEE 5323]
MHYLPIAFESNMVSMPILLAMKILIFRIIAALLPLELAGLLSWKTFFVGLLVSTSDYSPD